jgi:hypothetical protein
MSAKKNRKTLSINPITEIRKYTKGHETTNGITTANGIASKVKSFRGSAKNAHNNIRNERARVAAAKALFAAVHGAATRKEADAIVKAAPMETAAGVTTIEILKYVTNKYIQNLSSQLSEIKQSKKEWIAEHIDNMSMEDSALAKLQPTKKYRDYIRNIIHVLGEEEDEKREELLEGIYAKAKKIRQVNGTSAANSPQHLLRAISSAAASRGRSLRAAVEARASAAAVAEEAAAEAAAVAEEAAMEAAAVAEETVITTRDAVLEAHTKAILAHITQHAITYLSSQSSKITENEDEWIAKVIKDFRKNDDMHIREQSKISPEYGSYVGYARHITDELREKEKEKRIQLLKKIYKDRKI